MRIEILIKFEMRYIKTSYYYYLYLIVLTPNKSNFL